MAKHKLRAQGVLYTTLVDFLIQIVFLLVLMLAPVMIYINKSDVEGLNRLYPQIKKFLPKAANINWNDMELALVPKAISKAYDADPERFGKDLKDIMQKVGLDPKVATLNDLKARLASYKSLEEKASKYDKLVGKPMCSLSISGEGHSSRAMPLLDVVLMSGGMNIKAASEDASKFLQRKINFKLGADWEFKSGSEYASLFDSLNRIDSSCNHVVIIQGDETPVDAKEEFKRLISIIDRTSYKQERYHH